MKDGLTVISSQPLISPEKIQDKTLDQMSLPERADLLREAYQHVNDDATANELEVIGMMESKLEEKIVSWGLVVKKITEAAELCKVEADYYQKKANESNTRAEAFQNKIDGMGEYIK